MKRQYLETIATLIGLFLCISFLASVSVSDISSFQAVTQFQPLLTDNSVELMGDVAIPDRSNLELVFIATTNLKDGEKIQTYFYRDPIHLYKNKRTKGEEFPYLEMIKEGPQGVFCVGTIWIDPKSLITYGFADAGAAHRSPSGTLSRIDTSYIEVEKFRRSGMDV